MDASIAHRNNSIKVVMQDAALHLALPFRLNC